MKKFFTTAQVSKLADVHKDTILRWLRQGVVSEPNRNPHGWRVFTSSEAKKIAMFAKSLKKGEPLSTVISKQSKAIQRLKEIDWDFRDAKTNYLTHSMHPYPAKFIPQIPNALIQELSSIGDTVGDIFCGSGTTLVEGLLLKRNVIGLDANPLACLISKAKTTRINADDKEHLLQLAQRVQHFVAEVSADDQTTLFETSKFMSKAPRPKNDAIDFWFDPFVVEELAEILFWCNELPNIACRNVALVSFSSIIVSVSKQDSDTRYVRRKKGTKPGDTFKRFAQVLLDNIKAVEKFTDILEPNLKCRVFFADILDSPPIPKMDLVVCSPPYPNAYSYHLYHMTRMLWLGMEKNEFKKKEIGSHRKYSTKSKNGATIETFKSEMITVFNLLKESLMPWGIACFVIGNSIIRGETYNNADVLKEASSKAGFLEVGVISRNLKATRKAFNPRIGKINTEKIVIFQNIGG